MSSHSSIVPAQRFSMHDLFEEDACSHSGMKEKKATCERSRPGEGISGCAFEGAYRFLAPIQEAAHLIHSPSTCASVVYLDDISETHNAFSTHMTVNDLVFGSEATLKESIDEIVKRYAPRVIFLYVTCVSSMTGEDVEMIARIKEEAWNVRIVPVIAAGFLGMKNLGSRIGAMSLLRSVIGCEEPSAPVGYAINLWGNAISETQKQIYRSLLAGIGVEVLSFMGALEEVTSLMQAHRAKLNVLIHAKSLVHVAQKFEATWNVPFVEVSFVGKEATADALRVIAEFFNDGKLCRQTQTLICHEEKMLHSYMETFQPLLAHKKVLVNLKGMLAWAYLPLLETLGMEVVAIAIETISEDDKEKAVDLFLGKGSFMYEPREEQLEILAQTPIDLFISDSENRDVALVAQVPFLNVDHLKDALFVGYEGIKALVEQIDFTLRNPVFKIIHQKAPWEN